MEKTHPFSAGAATHSSANSLVVNGLAGTGPVARVFYRLNQKPAMKQVEHPRFPSPRNGHSYPGEEQTLPQPFALLDDDDDELDDEEDDESDDLILGDEDELDDADLEEVADVEIDDDIDDDLDDDDLVLDANDDEDEEDDV
ncbi:hypothetical protein GCM10028786_23920 [Flaviaesturariibacter terrae]